MKTTTYAGNGVFNINFGLYGYDEIDFEESKNEIKRNFEKEKLEGLKKALIDLGLKFNSLKWYSPREYNFSNDSIDLTIEIVDKDILKKAILQNKDIIQKNLSKNKSYDGYMSLTRTSVSEELEELNMDSYRIDIIVLGTLLNIYYPELSDFDINEYLVYEDLEMSLKMAEN